jgi:pimeloyl-ACP methyl ester carboxylesterase
MRGANRFWPTKLFGGKPDTPDPDEPPGNCEFMKTSPYSANLYKMTARLVYGVEVASTHVLLNPQLWPKAVPLLYLYGGKDRVISPGVSGAFAQKLAEQPSVDATVRFYPDAPHVLLWSQQHKTAIVTDVLAFIIRTMRLIVE